MSGLIRQSRR